MIHFDIIRLKLVNSSILPGNGPGLWAICSRGASPHSILSGLQLNI